MFVVSVIRHSLKRIWPVDLGYDAALLSLADLKNEDISTLVEHARTIASVIPIIGFYLQPSVGGRVLPFEFWRKFVEIENVVAIKIAPFNRYQTIDVVRAVAQSGRAKDIALYTGNDDNILLDLLTQYESGWRTSAHCRRVAGPLGSLDEDGSCSSGTRQSARSQHSIKASDLGAADY